MSDTIITDGTAKFKMWSLGGPGVVFKDYDIGISISSR